MSFSNYEENKLVDHLFRTSSYPKPTALWVALFTSDPTDAGVGTEVSTTSTGYGRVQHGPGDADWLSTNGSTSGNSSGTGGQTSNATAITFGSPIGDWGPIGWAGIYDSETGGNLLRHGPLSSTKTVNSGDNAPEFQPGAIVFNLG